MGASASCIWTEICAIQSEDIRAHMLETTMASPELVAEAKRAGVYGNVLAWLAAHRRGAGVIFPYASARPGSGSSATPTRWSAMYATPITHTHTHSSPHTHSPHTHSPHTHSPHTHSSPHTNTTELIVSPAAKALDYFQESLELLGISESEELTYDRLKSAYKRASLRAHPDKGGSKEAFDTVQRSYRYVERILQRISPQMSAADKARMTGVVSMETATEHRRTGAPAALPDTPPISLSAKKLDMGVFNRLFEENRLPDPARDNGYGDWLKSQSGSDDVMSDPRLSGKFNQTTFENVFREKALQQTAGMAIVKRLAPDALVPTAGTELGGDAGNFTAAFGADTQFTDLKEAYTTGSTVFHEVADVRVEERKVRSVGEAEARRAAEMARVDPDESMRIAAAAAAVEERERQRRLRLAQQDTAMEAWSDQIRRRMYVTNG